MNTKQTRKVAAAAFEAAAYCGELESLIREIVGYQDNAFDSQDEIDGGDLLEFIAGWRLRALGVLK